jgi:hypothetical protein
MLPDHYRLPHITDARRVFSCPDQRSALFSHSSASHSRRVSLIISVPTQADFAQPEIERITLAGLPPTRVFGGTSLVTTEPAAMTELSPKVTPPMMVAPAAIQTFLPITIGFAITKARRWEGSIGCPDVIKLPFGPIITSSAMSIPPRSYIVQFWLMNTFRPTRVLSPPVA